ncbi:MAG: hypothetical protein H0T72_09670, partial [Chloroflexia bacterium]|nr:hypothetical protein [Chloroflexia bacterium]
MNAGDARTRASRWIERHAADLPGFTGAYFAGSICALSDEAPLPPSSDVDVMVVLDGDPPAKVGKFSHDDVLLEITFLTRSLFDTPEGVLGKYHLAASFA